MRRLNRFAVAVVVAGALAGQLSLSAQKPGCIVSDLSAPPAQAAQGSDTKPPTAKVVPDTTARDLSPADRKAAASDAQKAVTQAQEDATKQHKPVKESGGIMSIFSPSDPARASKVDRKREATAASFEMQYLAPVLARYHVSCYGLREIVTAERAAAAPAAPPTAAPTK